MPIGPTTNAPPFYVKAEATADRIYQALKQNGPMTTAALMKALNLNYGQIGRGLRFYRNDTARETGKMLVYNPYSYEFSLAAKRADGQLDLFYFGTHMLTRTRTNEEQLRTMQAQFGAAKIPNSLIKQATRLHEDVQDALVAVSDL